MWAAAAGQEAVAGAPSAAAAGAAAGGAPPLSPNAAANDPAAYAAALQAAADNVIRPAVPAVLMVADRQVYVENVDVPPSGYVLVRRWMRNEPEQDVESIVGPSTSALILPKPLATPPEPDVPEPPPLEDDVDNYDAEQAVCDLKRHWVRLRKHSTAKRAQRLGRYRDRIKLVSAASALAIQNMMSMQQRQAQQAQQAQLLQDLAVQQQAQQRELAEAMLQQHQDQEHQAAQQGTVLLQLPPHALNALRQQQQAAAEAAAADAQQQAQAQVQEAVAQQLQLQLAAAGDPDVSAAMAAAAGAAAAAAIANVPPALDLALPGGQFGGGDEVEASGAGGYAPMDTADGAAAFTQALAAIQQQQAALQQQAAAAAAAALGEGGDVGLQEY